MISWNSVRRAVDTMPGEITRLLQRVDGGDRDAVEQLLPLVYEELRVLAASQLAGERPGHTLQPTALVHEAWIRLSEKSHPRWSDHKHFYRAAAVVMRCILVDYARARRRQKRGGGAQTLPLDEQLALFEERALDLIALDEALRKLEAVAPRQTDIIELRFFAGLTNKEAAQTLGISERTAQADWRLARAWLLEEMTAA